MSRRKRQRRIQAARIQAARVVPLEPRLRLPRFDLRAESLALAVPFLVVFNVIFGQFFPNRMDRLGHDYYYFLPHLLAGDYWFRQNGFWSVPWFTPAFCGGVPQFPNPQGPYYSAPQWLSFWVDPLSAVHVTLLLFAGLGFMGAYALLRRSFEATRPAALLGAVLFMFNGLFAHRMLIGHLAFHSYMLLPLVMLALLPPGALENVDRPRQWLFDGALGGVLLAYVLVSGFIEGLPALVSVAVVGLVHGILFGRARRFWRRAVVAGVAGLSLGAAKLSADVAYLSHFPRDDYLLPGVPSLVGIVRLAAESLFVRPAYAAAQTMRVNQQWVLDRQELEFGVTLVPAVLLVLGAAVWLYRAWRCGFSGRRPRSVALLQLGLVAVLLSLPIAVNYYSPGWNRFLKALPLVGNGVTPTRWFMVYIPVVIVAAMLALDRLRLPSRSRWIAASLGVATCLLTNALTDREFYQEQPYNPAPILSAYDSSSAAVRPIVAIGGPGIGNDGLVIGISPAFCYEALFGYRLERFPKESLTSGPIMREQGGVLNLKNPACYVFPVANGCRPGDHFKVSEREQATALAHYRPFIFALPWTQRLANGLSASSIVTIALFLLLESARRTRRGDKLWSALRKRVVDRLRRRPGGEP